MNLCHNNLLCQTLYEKNALQKQASNSVKAYGKFNEFTSCIVRKLFDDIKSNVRSIESLGVEANSYGSLLVPIIMNRLPQTCC